MNIKYYKSDKGLYVYTNGYGGLSGFLINDKEAEPTHKNTWFFVEGEEAVNSLKKDGGYRYVNYRWELVDSELTKIGAPSVISQEDSKEYTDDDYGWSLGADVKFKNMYTRKCDKVPAGFIDVEYTATFLGDVETYLLEGTNVESYKVSSRSIYDNKDKVFPHVNLADIVSYSDITEMLCNPLTIHNQPCKIPVNTTYTLIRNYVKDNIKSKYAKVTSDYDFCFAVQKIIPITPIHHKTEVKKANGRSYAKPRYKHRTETDKRFIIFEMAPKVYNSYPIIKCFEGNSLQDLAENVRLYLDDLISTINEPLVECGSCNGTGFIIEKVN